jgi:ubiquinone biosynthesis accessory factor UbiJ
MLNDFITRALGRALEASPRAGELCARLDGRSLQVNISGLPACFVVTANAGALRLSLGSTAAAAGADVTVHGSPLALLALAQGEADAAVARGTIAISGDAGVARQFQELARLLRPDLESLLQHLAGRVPAHLATRALGALGAWSRAARESLLRSAAEYLAHEQRDLVPRAEAEGFLGGVESLRTQLTRAEQRLAGLDAGVARLAALRKRA